jgi:hypothetical protein
VHLFGKSFVIKGGSMPSVSEKQAKFMRAVAGSKEFADKVGVPQSVGKEFVEADKKAEEKKESK